MSQGGISDETIDRIYRSLFVYSVGFHELIQTCLKHTKDQYSLVIAIWKVYAILLEYSCKSDYNMIVQEMNKDNSQKLKQLEDEFNLKIQDLVEDESQLKQEIELIHKYTFKLEQEKETEQNVRSKLEEELLQNNISREEEEVQLRLKFESKLNNMHFINRDLNSKYRRALLDIETLQNTNELLNSKKIESVELYNQMKTEYEEQIAIIKHDKKKIEALEFENNSLKVQVVELCEKSAIMQAKADKLQYKSQVSLKKITELQFTVEANVSQIQTLKTEKDHLKQNEKEARSFKELFEQKYRDTTEEIKKLTDDFQLAQREIIGFDEIKKEREERIDRLKSELNEITEAYDKVDTELTKISNQFQMISSKFYSLNIEYSNTVDKLKKINQARNEKEEKLSLEKYTNTLLNKQIAESKEQLKQKDVKIEDLNNQIKSKDREITRLHYDYDSLEKRTTLHIKQLNDKILNVSGVLLAEQQSSGDLSEKYQEEKKLRVDAETELVTTKSHNKDLEFKIKDFTVKTEMLQTANSKLQDKLNELTQIHDNIARELNSKSEFLKQVEINNDEVLGKQIKENIRIKTELKLMLSQQEMFSEDIQIDI